jgi:outer membrane lipopolysaccharide assembly protein LptE/RlpB
VTPRSLLTERERITAELINKVNQAMVKRMREIENEEAKKKRQKKKVKRLKIEEN